MRKYDLGGWELDLKWSGTYVEGHAPTQYEPGDGMFIEDFKVWLQPQQGEPVDITSGIPTRTLEQMHQLAVEEISGDAR